MPILLMASALPPPVVQAQTHVGPGVPAPARIEVPGEGVTIPMQDMGGRPVVAMRVPARAQPIGNIGYEVLRYFAVTLDSQNRRVRIDQ
jgi:hypothetical protein